MSEDPLLYVTHSDLKPRERACILARCKTFQDWVTEHSHFKIRDEEDAAIFIRAYCQVKSRNDIIKDSDALDKLNQLHQAFVKHVEYAEEKSYQKQENPKCSETRRLFNKQPSL